jgi:hypothetical protein
MAKEPDGIEPGAAEDVGNPTIDEFLDGLAQRIGKHRPCPICGGTDWIVVAPNPMSVLVGAASPAAGPPDDRALNLAVLVCSRCRFVRTHLTTPLATDETGA